jgi:hypothetical protein
MLELAAQINGTDTDGDALPCLQHPADDRAHGTWRHHLRHRHRHIAEPFDAHAPAAPGHAAHGPRGLTDRFVLCATWTSAPQIFELCELQAEPCADAALAGQDMAYDDGISPMSAELADNCTAKEWAGMDELWGARCAGQVESPIYNECLAIWHGIDASNIASRGAWSAARTCSLVVESCEGFGQLTSFTGLVLCCVRRVCV